MKKNIKNKSRGESLIEILMAFAIFAIILPAILYGMGSVGTVEPRRDMYFTGAQIIEDTKNIIHQIKNSDWTRIATNGSYSINPESGTNNWTLSPLVIPAPTVAAGITRSVTIANATRNGSGNLDSAATTSDAATKKITINIGYPNNTSYQTDLYVTRYDSVKVYKIDEAAQLQSADAVFNGTKMQVVSGADGEVTITTEPPNKNTQNNLWSWWKMDGGTLDPTLDTEPDVAPSPKLNLLAYPYSQTASAADHVTYNSTSRFGKSVAFSGSDYFKKDRTENSDSDVCVAAVCAIEVLLKPNGSSKPVFGWADVVPYPQSVVAGTMLNLDSTTSGIFNFEPKGYAGIQLLTGVLPSGVYTHLLFVNTGSKETLYVNGIKSTSENTISIPKETSSRDIYIGTRIFGPTPPATAFTQTYFNGEIDDMALYNGSFDDIQAFNLAYSSYTSPTIDLLKTRQIFNVIASIVKPANTDIKMQIATTNPTSGDCTGGNKPTDFKGATNLATVANMYTTSQTGTTTIGGKVDINIATARCVALKVYFFSQNAYANANNPKLSNLKIIYAE